MPLFTSPDPTDASTVQQSDAQYLIFYSSVDAAGQMWCPDCRRVEEVVRKAFEPLTAPSALIVFVGQRNTTNEFRGSPWNVTSVPTIIGRDDVRFVDDEVNEEALRTLTKTKTD
ncbi:uncharacterized protein FOMMEDRAFT_27663 [Fomitiporia mediterranea MF3/22]|uniref:uncharacterized protein n=1 Tax=Fomitiporia mediterranea (strain MF3/22) TaxID=694068 RepID=UPI0004408B37|nr:uncharacterized protein FOMMEDRAFT_27663 [Fomitiporia mediterranea MF3/22]EJD03788.1 hypothetical protein FOMMEDRAFT_27663 [Fomitiporia mediterranea MF3/22]